MPTESRCDGTVLITCQKPEIPAWIDNTRIVSISPLDPDTAAMCIFKYLGREPFDENERELACRLADHVGCLPLAMATIGGYVKQSTMSLEEFFENIKHKATLWDKASKVQETQVYQRSLDSVFDKAFEDLPPAARELLNVLAFLDPDSIPEDVLENAIERRRFEHVKDKDDLKDCYFELRGRQLIRRDSTNQDSYIAIHRVVQWNVLRDLATNSYRRLNYFQQACNIVKDLLPATDQTVVPEPEKWPPYARHGRQILELRRHC